MTAAHTDTSNLRRQQQHAQLGGVTLLQQPHQMQLHNSARLQLPFNSRHCRTQRRQHQQGVYHVWLALLLLSHTVLPSACAAPAANAQQQQQQQLDSTAAGPAGESVSWQLLQQQARQRRQQFNQHTYQQQLQQISQQPQPSEQQAPYVLQQGFNPVPNDKLSDLTILQPLMQDLNNHLAIDQHVPPSKYHTLIHGIDNAAATAGGTQQTDLDSNSGSSATDNDSGPTPSVGSGLNPAIRAQQYTAGLQQGFYRGLRNPLAGVAQHSSDDSHVFNQVSDLHTAGVTMTSHYDSSSDATDVTSVDYSTAAAAAAAEEPTEVTSSSSSVGIRSSDTADASSVDYSTAAAAAAEEPIDLSSRSSSSSSSSSVGVSSSGYASPVSSRELTEVDTYGDQPRPSAFGDGSSSSSSGLTTAAEQLLEPGGNAPPGLTGDLTAAVDAVAGDVPTAAAAVHPAADDQAGSAAAGSEPGAAAAAVDGSSSSTDAVAIAAAAEAEADDIPGGAIKEDGSTSSSSSSSSEGSSSSSPAGPPPWAPKVLDAPVPKWPRLYSTVAPPAPTLAADVRPAAVSALLATARAAKTPQGISISGIPGLSLEDKILLARLLGHIIPGTFDAAGQMSPNETAYWELLDAQIEKHTQVKHMFESIWYKCSKLNADLLMRASSAHDMEVEALQHILAWLGFPERHLPRPGEFADFDDLVTLLDGIGAKARLVTDPVPFLSTTRPPVDRNGMPMLIHMTFKDKGQFARHHLLSLASWARENPDHAILMYDDADLEAYLSTYHPSVLELYSSLKTAVERSDLWRYVVMCKHGGVYTDADTLCVRPIQEWNSENHNDAEALFGVEDVFKRDPNGGNSGWGVSMGRFGIQFEQWTLAGAPNHSVYCNMHNFISQRIMEEASKQSPAATTERENWSILHRTGPHVWTDSVLNWMHDQGIGFHEALVPGGRLVANNTRILPGETFGCAAHFFSPAARLEEVYAMHMFRGVWRKRLDSGGADADRHHFRLGF